MEPLIIKNTIGIKASTKKVWDALTKSEYTKQYMFGCETISDWKEGSELLWQMMHEGKELIAVKGFIKSIEPGKSLVYTVFDPNSTLPDVPENYLTVTYKLKDLKGETLLTVTQGDYNKVAEGPRRYKEAYNDGQGWSPILVQIKDLLES